MIAIVLLPVVALGWFAYGQAKDASAHRADVAELRVAIGDLTDQMELASALGDERLWSYAVQRLEEVGIGPAMVTALMGVDPWRELESTRTRVDGLVADADATQVASEVEAVRNDPTIRLEDRADAYEHLAGLVSASAVDTSARLVELSDATDLGAAIGSLRLTVHMRDDVAAQVAGYYALRFPASLPTVDAVRLLIARSDQYARSRELLLATLRPGSPIAAALEEVALRPEVRRFADDVDLAIRDTLADGADETPEVDLATFAGQAKTISEGFLAASTSVMIHSDLVDVAASDVDTLAAAIERRASTEAREAIVLGVGVALLAVAGAVLSGRAIVAPLRRMSDAAEAMRHGMLTEHVDERGPRELQVAARAMNEAVAQLQLAEQQALALAKGDLDDPVLEVTAPGALGQSLREAVAHLIASLNDREEFRRRLAHEAAHDPLTGLPNRTTSIVQLNRALGRAQRTGDHLAVLLVDLDGFKQINDLHGHGTGDRVLVQVARRLSEGVRQSDVVGRLGADEFIVVAEPISDIAEAELLAERLRTSLDEQIMAGGRGVSITASVGISVADGLRLADDLIREADVAIVEAKRSGGARIQFCDDDLRAGIAIRSNVERGLAQAIENDELTLYVQEVVDARREQACSLEALVRWKGPDGRIILPDEFIAVAESSDLIVALDRWVIDRAATLLAQWADDPRLARLPLAVNLSGRHLRHPDLVEHVLDPLRTHGVDPRRLTVEVTETALLDDLASAATHLLALRDAGVTVAIDDFGTGYTSLAHLRALPVDVLKIDGSFISNLARDDERSLVRMIVEIGHLFGLTIVAEGVESAADARELLLLGVDALQGYHYSRPRPAEELSQPAVPGLAASTRPHVLPPTSHGGSIG